MLMPINCHWRTSCWRRRRYRVYGKTGRDAVVDLSLRRACSAACVAVEVTQVISAAYYYNSLACVAEASVIVAGRLRQAQLQHYKLAAAQAGVAKR